MIPAIIFSAAVSAQTAPSPQPAPPITAVGNTTQERHVDKHEKQRNKKHDKESPDADLIGFLGDYEDAADGLDPIGLSEQPAMDPPKQGDGP